MINWRLAIPPFLCLLLLGACSRPEATPGEPAVQQVAQESPSLVTLATPEPAAATSTTSFTPEPVVATLPASPAPEPAVATSTVLPTPEPAAATPTIPGTSAPAADEALQTPELPASDYLARRRSHATVLTSHRPAPYAWSDGPLPPGVTEVWYPSGELRLRAWLMLPKDAPAQVPAVVYFHGYFGLGWDEFAHCQPFLDAGYAVLLPALRGENGNPGDFQLWYGEIEDAAAAVRWLAAQPNIDAGHIYAFGYSVGGGVSTLLSLWDDVPVRLIGSSGGLYTAGIFGAWTDILPFDLNDAQEVQLRLLRGNMASMRHRHIAYLGQDEWLAQFAPAAEAEAKACGAPLTVQYVPGDHYTALPRAIAAFIEAISAHENDL